MEKNNLYIQKIEVKDLFGFKDLSISFGENNPGFFTMLLGDNSSGKTSLLRCIALGLMTSNGAIRSIDHLPGVCIRHGASFGKLDVTLLSPEGDSYLIKKRFYRGKQGSAVLSNYFRLDKSGARDEIRKEDDFPFEHLFVCGYGSGRLFDRSAQPSENYKYNEAVESLFRYSKPLQSPELSLRRVLSAARKQAKQGDELKAEQEVLDKFLQLIEKIFMFDEDEKVELTEKGIEVVSHSGRSLLIEQGDGYKNTAAWILDFITWNMLARRPLDPKAMTGIVLIDEIEQHLHPKWQRYVIKLLKEQFPGVQFIAATHSPLCAAGTADPEEGDGQVVHLFRDENQLLKAETLDSLRGLKADQVLTSEAFNLPTTRNTVVAKKLSRFSDLYLKEERDKQEEEEFLALREYLDLWLPEPAEEASTRILQKKLKTMLEDMKQLAAAREKKDD